MISWSVILHRGCKSSFDHVLLKLNCKILGEILVCHITGVNHLLTMCMLNLKCKILGEIPGLSNCIGMGSQSSFDHVHVES